MLFCQVLFYKNMENYSQPVKLRTQFKFFVNVPNFASSTEDESADLPVRSAHSSPPSRHGVV